MYIFDIIIWYNYLEVSVKNIILIVVCSLNYILLIFFFQIIDFLLYNYFVTFDGFGINYCDILLGEIGMIFIIFFNI